MNYFEDLAGEFEPFVEDAARTVPTGPRFQVITTTALLETAFPDIRWIVPGYLPEGLSILAGRQKLGKTWLAIDWAIAVATGGLAMGVISCERGDVLYIDLENGPRRIQRRLEILAPVGRDQVDMSHLQWTSQSPQLNRGLISALDHWRLDVEHPRLVVIDVLQRIKPAGHASRNAYENDYTAMAELQQWANRNEICVLALHHTRKGGADDPLEALSGSNGLSACADTTLLLDRDSSGMSLYVRGRDVEERDSAMKFETGRWTVMGEADVVRRSGERSEILSALMAADTPLTPIDVAARTDMKRNSVDQLLHKMAVAGEVRKVGRGRYIHPGRIDLIEGASSALATKNGKTIRADPYKEQAPPHA